MSIIEHKYQREVLELQLVELKIQNDGFYLLGPAAFGVVVVALFLTLRMLLNIRVCLTPAFLIAGAVASFSIYYWAVTRRYRKQRAVIRKELRVLDNIPPLSPT